MVYNIVRTFPNTSDRKGTDLTAAQIPAAIAALDNSGDFARWYVTRNGVRIDYI